MNALGPYIGIAKAVALIALIIVLFAAGHHFGAQGVQAEWDKEKMTAENQAEILRLARQGSINRIDQAGAAKAQKQLKADQSILAKVEKNVPNTLPMLPGSFRVQHDAAATGEEANDTRAADAAPVAPRIVARSITANYQSAREDKERLAELQAVVRASGCFDLEGE